MSRESSFGVVARMLHFAPRHQPISDNREDEHGGISMPWFRRQYPGRELAPPTISARQLAERIERGLPTVILDVRQPTAYAEYPGAIPGSVRIPPAELPDRYGELPRDRPIVTYCT